MASLYAMAEEFSELFDKYDDIMELALEADEETRHNAEEAWFTTLDTLEEDIEIKVENLALYIKHLESSVDEMADMVKRIQARIKVKKNTITRLKEYGIACLDTVHLKKVDRPGALVSVRNNAVSVDIPDERAFIRWAKSEGHEDMLKYTEPTISKTAVKEYLTNGECPYAELKRTRSLVIK